MLNILRGNNIVGIDARFSYERMHYVGKGLILVPFSRPYIRLDLLERKMLIADVYLQICFLASSIHW